jgi:hypothetical protein
MTNFGMSRRTTIKPVLGKQGFGRIDGLAEILNGSRN